MNYHPATINLLTDYGYRTLEDNENCLKETIIYMSPEYIKS